jgi:hypothetical protein
MLEPEERTQQHLDVYLERFMLHGLNLVVDEGFFNRNEFKAMQAGFNLKLSTKTLVNVSDRMYERNRNCTSLTTLQIFEECADVRGLTLCEVAVGWTRGLYKMVLNDVGELISALDVASGGLLSEDQKCCAPNLYLLIAAYLRGVGHPDIESVRNVVDAKTRTRDAQDHLIRSVAFIRAITGTPFLPASGSLTVRLLLNKPCSSTY